jgi:hypothetical protein
MGVIFLLTNIVADYRGRRAFEWCDVCIQYDNLTVDFGEMRHYVCLREWTWNCRFNAPNVWARSASMFGSNKSAAFEFNLWCLCSQLLIALSSVEDRIQHGFNYVQL